MYDSKINAWMRKHLGMQTTVCKCEKCGLLYKPSLGHECKVKQKQIFHGYKCDEK